jgi:hypothetical protein
MSFRLATALSALAFVSTIFCSPVSSQAKTPHETTSQYLNTRPGVNYVGSKVCESCHPVIYHQYFKTAMGRSMALPDNPSLPSPRAPVGVYSYRLDRDFAIFRRGSGLYQTEPQPASNGTEVFHNTRRSPMRSGGIGYLVRQGNYLVEAPLSYYTQNQTWELSPGYEAADIGFDRVVSITCHDPHVEPTAAQAPAYYREKCLLCHSLKSCAAPMAARMRTSPPDNCIACHMPGQKLKTISHSALTNHRIIAYPGEPFPKAAFHMTTPSLPDLVFLDRAPGEERPSSVVLLQAYEELRSENPDYQAPEQRLLHRLAKTETNNPIVLSALGHMAADKGNFSDAQEDIRRAIAAGSRPGARTGTASTRSSSP